MMSGESHQVCRHHPLNKKVEAHRFSTAKKMIAFMIRLLLMKQQPLFFFYKRKEADTTHSFGLTQTFDVFIKSAESSRGTIFLLLQPGPVASMVMKKTEVSPALLKLLVRVYNQSIQSYYFFPEVIICGQHRLEREEFNWLRTQGYIYPYHTDSFGKLYRLTPEGDAVLRRYLQHRRSKLRRSVQPSPQAMLSFC